MFKNRSITAFIGLVLALAYALWSSAAAAGNALVFLLAITHVLIIWVGVIFGILGFFMRKVGFTLTAAILYASAALFFLLWGWLLIPSIVLGFIGYVDQKKINKA